MKDKSISKIRISLYVFLIFVVAFVISYLFYYINFNKSTTPLFACDITYQPSVKSYPSYPHFCINKNKVYTGVIETNYGNIDIALYPKAAPKTVNSFVFLAKSGFYNNLIFQRVIKGFVIQGGDPTGTGSGGPGYTFNDEINAVSLGIPSVLIKAYVKKGYTYSSAYKSIPFSTGVLAMANSGANTNGSQFFITLGKDTQLNGMYTVFGKVTKGMSVAQKIGNVPVNKKAHDAPLYKVIIKRIIIN